MLYFMLESEKKVNFNLLTESGGKVTIVTQ